MLNNKGQSLILFVIILPIFLLIFVLVIDVGKVINLKQELDNINKIVLDYGLDNLDEVTLDDKLIKIVKLNNSEIDKIDVNIDNNIIYIYLNESIDGIFSQFIDISIFNVKSSYKGYYENGEKRIMKVSGWLECMILVEK